MSLLPYAWAKSQRILLRPGEDGMLLTVCPSTPGWSISEVQRQFGQSRVEQIRDDELDGLLTSAYADTGSAAAVVGAAENEVDLDRLMQDMPEITDLLDTQDGAPVIRMINALLTQAARDEASHIHIEPYETHSVVRYRVDGTLRDVVSPRKALHGALVSRIKIMAQLDIAEKRLPQDGRIALRVAGRPIDIRVSTVPTGHGERVVMRLLDKQAGRLQLETLGMEPKLLARLDTLIRQPHGIVLVTGPTGSGKTTSLYAALARLDASTSNILTVEDPVEYDLPGISQIQVNAKIDMTFGLALRAILRQDPDIIMIGEIRDLETAQIAVQASLTGHLVLATLHTNDAVSAVNRLIDMGVEPFLLASSLLGVLAQRLVRRLCPHCKQEDPAAPGTWRPVGCAQCSQVGYSGRTGIHELFCVDDDVRSLIHQGAVRADVRGGMRLADALAARPRDFPSIYRALIAAGEESGDLAQVMERLADYIEERNNLRGKILTAFIYPGVVGLVSIGIVIFLLSYVVPQVVSAFSQARQDLPGLTLAMLNASDFIRAWGWLCFAGIVGGFWSWRLYLRNPVARLNWHSRVLRLPLIGRFVLGLNTARFASTLAILGGAGVPLLRALEAARQTLSNERLSQCVNEATAKVREGVNLAPALAMEKVFPPVLIHLIASGEKTGSLPPMLERAAQTLSRDIERRAMGMTALLEPLMIVVMGAVVLVIVMAVLLPIIEINQLVT